jgi:hypothetical protein
VAVDNHRVVAESEWVVRHAQVGGNRIPVVSRLAGRRSSLRWRSVFVVSPPGGGRIRRRLGLPSGPPPRADARRSRGVARASGMGALRSPVEQCCNDSRQLSGPRNRRLQWRSIAVDPWPKIAIEVVFSMNPSFAGHFRIPLSVFCLLFASSSFAETIEGRVEFHGAESGEFVHHGQKLAQSGSY